MNGIHANTVVVGSGPGGATVANELAKNGDDVLMIEQGYSHQVPVGNPLSLLTMYNIKRSKQGVLVRRGITTGGSTMIFSGNAADPPNLLKNYGIDLTPGLSVIKKEVGIKTVPESFINQYQTTRNIAEAADSLGYPMLAQERFINPNRCDPSCDQCLFGCKKEAKWTARTFVDSAVAHGAKLITGQKVNRVLHTSDGAEGVEIQNNNGLKKVFANRVVIAAGGIGTPEILQKSGIDSAGKHFFTDPMAIVAGVMKTGKGTYGEMTYTFANEAHLGDFIFGNVGAVNAFSAQVAALNYPFLKHALHLKKVAGMFVKVCDDPEGSIDENGTMTKRLSESDKKKMEKGIAIAKAILVKAGIDGDSISVARGIGGHPGGSAAIGRVVDNTLETRIKNLFVCDNSIMPESGGIPPVLTLIALGKQFSRYLLTT